VASTVEAVLAQRLVRVLCNNCKAESHIDRTSLGRMDPSALKLQRAFTAVGCPECRNTGYRGRTGVFELLIMDDDIRNEMMRNRGSGEIRALAIAKGMRTLQGDGIRLVGLGVTSIEEVLRVTRA
jgi:type II secretory ATPase GspE/PulE/Tfp pilus assembly ATPase PilB-like protein